MYTNRNSISLAITTLTLALVCLAEPALLICGILMDWDIWFIIATMVGVLLAFPIWCFVTYGLVIVLCFIAAFINFLYQVVTGKV